MEVILREDVKKLGRAGDTVKVADGYGRNFLLPKSLAVLATPANMKRTQQELQSKKGQAKRIEQDAKYLAEAMSEKPIVIRMAAGEGGKLFGSVTSADIEKVLADRNITVDKRKIELEEPIKTLGNYEVNVKVHADVVATLTVVVEDEQVKKAEEAKAEEAKAEEVKAEEVKAEEVKAEEVKAEEVKAEAAPVEEAKAE